MKNVKLKFAAIVLASIALVSCSKDDDLVLPTPIPTPVYPFYIVGVEDVPSSSSTVKYWNTNGTSVTLSDGTEDTYATNYLLNGNDIHTVGYESGIPDKAKYWKNGTEVNINIGTGYSAFYDVFVTGNDIYIAGSHFENGKYLAKYWKNGNEVVLGDGTSDSWLYSIFVKGNDVYALGGEGINSVYWKNGIKTVLGNEEFFTIVADGNDVYVAGRVTSKAVCWKNGVEMVLEGADTAYSRAYDIKVKNGIVYVTGYIGSEAVYWKDGVRHNLDRSANTTYAQSSKIYFVNNDMYITGHEYSSTSGNTILKYWKNEEPFNVTDGTTYVYEANVYN